MEPLTEKNFTIIDPPGMSTLAFLINEPEEGASYCTLQKLDFTLPDPNDCSKKTFYIDPRDVEKQNEIILLTIGADKALLNTAVFTEDNRLFISKKSTKVGFKILFSDENMDFKDLKYTPNFKRPISIIDPDIPDEVHPVLYYDENDNMVKAKIRLQSNKSYIALEIKAE